MTAHAEELPAQSHGHHDHGHSGPKKSIWLRGSWVRAAWVTILGALIGRFGVMAVRSWLFGYPAHDSGVEDTFMMLFGGVGFLIGIGCFDYWYGYLIGQRRLGRGGPLRPRRLQLDATTSGSTPITR